MIGQRLSHFRIVDKIGEGGMGVVYRAEDENLGREVALKILHTEFITDEERRQRFLREARTAAALTHPNIATVHEVGEEGGVTFIAMELVEGRTLDSLVAGERPDTEAVLSIAIQVSEGLARAHQANVVHRDLKPENVVVDDDGRVKILDFGLAKLYLQAGPLGGDTSGLQTISAAMTRDGRILGTVAYMSPEQARGLEVDSRSDVFSLGILIYELVTGTRPFQGETVTDTLTAIIRDRQPPIARYNPKVPAELERILTRCLEKNPDDRFQDASEVLADLRRLRRISDSRPVPLVSDPEVTVAAGRRTRLRPWPLAMVGGALLLLALAAPPVYRQVTALVSGPAQRGLAVLPFENLQERADPDRLGQILQELIITDLSENRSLKVFSSQRLFDIQKQLGRSDSSTINRDIATRVASTAGAEIMLTGSLSQLGSTWILTTQLIDVDDGSVIKSERIDGSDLYTMVDDLTAHVRGDLGLVGDTDVAVSQRTSTSLEAYSAYLDGMDALNVLNFDEAAAQFDRALEVDPSFGRAYYKLAIARWWGQSFNAYELGSQAEAPGEVLKRLLSGDVKLTRKDRLLGEAFLALVRHRTAEAIPAFEELVRLYPEEKEAWYGLGEARFHGSTARAKRAEALEPFERALELDPGFSLAYYHVVDLYIRQRRYDEGMAKVRGFIENEPDNLSWYQDWGRLAAAKGDPTQIEEVVEESLRRIDSRADQRNFLFTVGMELSRDGEADLASQLFQRALAIDTPAMRERVLLALGETAMTRRDWAGAERLFREVHDADPKNAQALKDLFGLYDATGRYDEALGHAKRLIEKRPDSEAYYGYWLEAAVRGGREQEIARAAEGLDRLLARSAGSVDSVKLVGRRAVGAYLSVGNYAGAERRLEDALHDHPELLEDPSFRLGLGIVAQHRNRPEQAIEHLGEALRINPDLPEALAVLTWTYSDLGRHGEAVETAQRLSDLAGGNEPWASARLVEALLRAGRDGEAARVAREAGGRAKRARARVEYHAQLARAYLRAERYAEAAREARAGIELDAPPREPSLRSTLVAALARRGKVEDAAGALGEAREFFPEDPHLRREAAALRLVEGDAAGAERAVREILKTGPVHSDLRVLLAFSLAEKGGYEEAREQAAAAVEQNPDRHNRTALSWILVSGELDLRQGVELAQKAREMPVTAEDRMRTLPFTPSPEHCLGLAYLKQDRYREAVEMLEQAAALRPDRPSIRTDLARANELLLASNRR